MQVTFKSFRAAWGSWDALFQQASEFASELPDGKLINISHSAFNTDGVVTVWFYAD
ncbi:hypothetical protein OT109_06200 [Phycisphaeraceae bacterium D3-23]